MPASAETSPAASQERAIFGEEHRRGAAIAPASARVGREWYDAGATRSPRFLSAVAFVIGLLPFTALASLGAALGFLAGSVLRIRRAHVEHAMRRANIAGARAHAAGMYRSLGASLFELLWLAARPRSRAGAFARFDDTSESRLRDALAKGRGVVLAASHTGNWELAAAAISESFALTGVTKRIHSASVDAFVREARASRGWTAASGDAVLDVAREALARGEIAAMMIDQVPDRARHALRVELLGAPAFADRAPATLAFRTGAPLVVVASARDARGQQAMRVLAVLEPPAKGSPHRGRTWIADATRDASVALDTFVRTHPAEWLWMHRRWRAPLAT